MKHLMATALLLTFVGAALFFAPAGDVSARTLMPQNSNSSMTMQGDRSMHRMQRRRHHRMMRRHHRMTRRHHRMMRRHHRRDRRSMMSNSNHQ